MIMSGSGRGLGLFTYRPGIVTRFTFGVLWTRGIARNLFFFGGGIKVFGGGCCWIAVLTSFYPIKCLPRLILEGINTDIHPRRYAPAMNTRPLAQSKQVPRSWPSALPLYQFKWQCGERRCRLQTTLTTSPGSPTDYYIQILLHADFYDHRQFPLMSKLAKQILVIPASSAVWAQFLNGWQDYSQRSRFSWQLNSRSDSVSAGSW